MSLVTKIVDTYAFFKDQQVAVSLFNEALEGRTTGVVKVTIENMSGTDQDEKIKARIADWLKNRWDDGGSFDDTPSLLLDFYYFLTICEAQRQSL